MNNEWWESGVDLRLDIWTIFERIWNSCSTSALIIFQMSVNMMKIKLKIKYDYCWSGEFVVVTMQVQVQSPKSKVQRTWIDSILLCHQPQTTHHKNFSQQPDIQFQILFWIVTKSSPTLVTCFYFKIGFYILSSIQLSRWETDWGLDNRI